MAWHFSQAEDDPETTAFGCHPDTVSEYSAPVKIGGTKFSCAGHGSDKYWDAIRICLNRGRPSYISCPPENGADKTKLTRYLSSSLGEPGKAAGSCLPSPTADCGTMSRNIAHCVDMFCDTMSLKRWLPLPVE